MLVITAVFGPVQVEEIGPDTADILTAYFAEQKASAKRNPSKESKGSKSSKSSASGSNYLHFWRFSVDILSNSIFGEF